MCSPRLQRMMTATSSGSRSGGSGVIRPPRELLPEPCPFGIPNWLDKPVNLSNMPLHPEQRFVLVRFLAHNRRELVGDILFPLLASFSLLLYGFLALFRCSVAHEPVPAEHGEHHAVGE